MNETAPRVIKIPAKPESEWKTDSQRQLRVAAYCRVSTKEEDQANSYEVQKEYYTDKIMSNSAWTMAGIFADKGGIPLRPQHGGLPLLHTGSQGAGHRRHL